MSDAVRIAQNDVTEDRFSRFRLINWWDQEKISKTKVLVVGAGALGNEILKNMALLGFERVVVIDLDRVETTNLSRSVLYRARDIGKSKAEAAAAGYRDIYDQACVVPLCANILYEVGLGLFDWSDIIIAGLDNREARLWINRCAWKMNRPWIDGAIEGLNGIVRAFLPGQPPCYECTLGEVDWRILQRRMSCALLTHEEIEIGKVPTTPTTSAVIAGIEVQEALKHIHGMPMLSGKAYRFDGMNHTSYVVEYTENADCMSHEVYERIISLDDDPTLAQLHARARKELNADDVVVEFSRDIIHKLACPSCGGEEEIFAPLGTVKMQQAKCLEDGVARVVVTIHNYTGAESYGNRRLTELGLPLWDACTARAGASEVVFLMAGDAERVIGPLAERRRAFA